jgi:hypothetical protein
MAGTQEGETMRPLILLFVTTAATTWWWRACRFEALRRLVAGGRAGPSVATAVTVVRPAVPSPPDVTARGEES